MGLLKKLRRHAAVARGDFGMLFKDVKIPPLPAAVNRLIAEINRSEPDIDRLVQLISSDSEITAKVIKTVNSSLYSPRVPVADAKRAVTLLGLAQIRSIVLAFATMDALPKPKGNLFNHNAFWIDSLLRAILARVLSRKLFSRQMDEVFTASLLSELAVPLLLCVWNEYYEPIVKEWETSSKRLSELEREHFGWDHAQAGAWILQSWEFPEEMICYIGAHNISMEKIKQMDLQDTIVMPLAIAALSPSVLKPDAASAAEVFHEAVNRLKMDAAQFADAIEEAKDTLTELLTLFELPDQKAVKILDDLLHLADAGVEKLKETA
ncbi:MAG: HDOD domain-containing protein [Desulfobacterales bacterium]|nr:HDOD domain-containing protein [Desulfobacterales bacterium]